MMMSDSSKSSETGRDEEETILLLERWFSLWAPPLASALLGSNVSSRTQIASFCLPLLTTFVGGKGNRINASHAFAILLDEITSQGVKDGSKENEEALLWAKFEVRHRLNKLLKPKHSLSHHLYSYLVTTPSGCEACPLIELVEDVLYQ
jgi:hypothetical protein